MWRRLTSLLNKIDIPLLCILLLSAFLSGYNIWQDHYVNTYYTTAVASMLQSWHNFFFVSLDSAGSVSIDKPPVTFWLQAASAYLFGLHGWSVILPQVLAQIGSVFLLYTLLKPTFGLTAARLGAFAMACTPVAVSVSRTNNIDSMLVFTLLLAAWLLFQGIRRSSGSYIIASFALVGIGFNMKMLQAYMVIPAFILFYILAASGPWKRKVATLAGSILALLVVSLSWPLAVDSIPADQRPYVGSSGTNSVMNLAFGYNGIARLTGEREQGGMGLGDGRGNTRPTNLSDQTDAMTHDRSTSQDGSMNSSTSGSTSGSTGWRGTSNDRNQGTSNDPRPASGSYNQDKREIAKDQVNSNGGARTNGGPGAGGPTDGGPTGGGPGGERINSGGMFGTGTPGPLRLFQSELSGQASWLIPFAALAAISLLARRRIRSWSLQQKEVIFWLAWLIPIAGFFSIAGFFHHYYLIMLAPPLAALLGAGWVSMWTQYRSRESSWTAWLLLAAVLLTGVFAWYIMKDYTESIGSSWPHSTWVAGVIGAALLLWIRAAGGTNGQRATSDRRYMIWSRQLAVIASLIALFIGPLYWATTPITYGQNSMTPQAGPSQLGDRGGRGGPGGEQGDRALSAMDRNTPPGMLSPSADASDEAANVDEAPGTMTRFPGAADLMTRGGGMGGTPQADEKLLQYLRQHNTGETYSLATMNYTAAAPYLIDYGEKVIILHGFVQSDPVYDTDKLQALVESGQIKYFLVTSSMGSDRSGLVDWIKEHGREIPTAEWQSAASASAQLYEVTSPN
ncbi:Undecaprenyl phosphate-alpha-4-amino-4-deoxy-L-arabinose arabinosyl transferase [compost metagenome]